MHGDPSRIAGGRHVAHFSHAHRPVLCGQKLLREAPHDLAIVRMCELHQRLGLHAHQIVDRVSENVGHPLIHVAIRVRTHVGNHDARDGRRHDAIVHALRASFFRHVQAETEQRNWVPVRISLEHGGADDHPERLPGAGQQSAARADRPGVGHLGDLCQESAHRVPILRVNDAKGLLSGHREQRVLGIAKHLDRLLVRVGVANFPNVEGENAGYR